MIGLTEFSFPPNKPPPHVRGIAITLMPPVAVKILIKKVEITELMKATILRSNIK
jgi:hypothetical protein